MSSFSVFVDTGCDLSPEFVKEQGVGMIPMVFRLDGKEYPDGHWKEIDSAEYYSALRNGGMSTTSLANYDAFIKEFKEHAREGKPALYISLSSGISGSYHNSTLALADTKEQYPDCRIFTVDSMNAAGGYGLLAMLAVKKRNEGMSVEEVAAWTEQYRQNVIALFTVDDLMFLHRGGRLSRLSAVAGSLLGVKPMLNVAPNGTLVLKDKVRGRKAALEALVSQMKRCNKPGAALDTVTISHGDCLEDAQYVAKLLYETFSVREVVINVLAPVIGAHSGPGTVAMFFESEITRNEYENKYYNGKF